jgi:hypothetical protein
MQEVIGLERKEGTDEYRRAIHRGVYVLFEKHLMWTDQRAMDMFRAEHGGLNEDEVIRLFNQWVKKKKNTA